MVLELAQKVRIWINSHSGTFMLSTSWFCEGFLHSYKIHLEVIISGYLLFAVVIGYLRNVIFKLFILLVWMKKVHHHYQPICCMMVAQINYGSLLLKSMRNCCQLAIMWWRPVSEMKQKSVIDKHLLHLLKLWICLWFVSLWACLYHWQPVWACGVPDSSTWMAQQFAWDCNMITLWMIYF